MWCAVMPVIIRHVWCLSDGLRSAHGNSVSVPGMLGGTSSSVWLFLVHNMRFRHRPAILTEERHEDQPEHVERGHERGYDANSPENPVSMRTAERLPEDLVFREETR